MTATVPTPITVCLVEDHRGLREQLVALLEAADFAVVAAVGSLHAGRQAVTELHPDVAVIDSRFGDGTGVDLCHMLSAEMPEVALVLQSAVVLPGDVDAGLQAGARAVIEKTMSGTSLLDAIRRKGRLTLAGQPARLHRCSEAISR